MKSLTILVLITVLITNIKLNSQTIPQTLNYQGVLKDASGNNVPNGNYDITFNIYNTSSGGTALWTETKSVSVEDGNFSTQLGSVTAITLTFDEAYWLGVVVGGTELSPRIAFTSVPYSRMSLAVPDNSLTASKISSGQVVKSLNGIKDNVNLVAGSNITITPTGQNITISSSGSGGIGGSGTNNYLAKFTGTTTLGNSILYQSVDNKIGIDVASPSAKLDILGLSSWDLVNTEGDVRIGNGTYRLKMGIALGGGGAGHAYIGSVGGVNALSLGTGSTLEQMQTLTIRPGNVGIGTFSPSYPLHVSTNRKYAGYFTTDSLHFNSHAVHGVFTGTGSFDGVGVYGESIPADFFGIGGSFQGGYIGAYGLVIPTGTATYIGVRGDVSQVSTAGGTWVGVSGSAITSTGTGTGARYGLRGEAYGGTTNYGIHATAGFGPGTNWAGYFLGNVNVTGTLSKGGGSFKIDHPLDPANKYLYHSFVESPDMMNIYNGNIFTDGSGYASVSLPDWFEVLNKDFRYQLTVIGDFAQAIISQKVQNNQFTIKTDKPNVEVSWQVTGIRKDAFAEKYRIPVEEFKQPDEIGKYAHPDAFGLSEEMGVDYKHRVIEKDRK